MEIKVLGSGCSKCKVLMSSVEKALEMLGVKADIEKVEDINKIISYNVMITPALVINGKTVLSGRIADYEEIKRLVQKEMQS